MFKEIYGTKPLGESMEEGDARRRGANTSRCWRQRDASDSVYLIYNFEFNY